MGSVYYGSATNVGIVRKENQDAVYVKKNPANNLLALVCDGLGGYMGGQIASGLARDTFATAFRKTDFNDKPNAFIEGWFAQTVRAAREAIARYVRENEPQFQQHNPGQTLAQMATTVVASLLANNKIYTFWVGDSRAYLINNKPQTWQITEDHNLYNALKGIKASEETFRAHAKELLALTKIVSKDIKGEETFGVSIHEPKKREQYLLLCSDGFYNFVPPEGFFSLIQKNATDMNSAAELLVDEGMAHNSNDNLSVVLVDLFEALDGRR